MSAPPAAKARKGRAPKSPRVELPDATRAKVREIEADLSAAAESEVKSMVAVGRRVQEILADPGTYAVDKFKDIAPLFRAGRDTIRPCYVLATRYDDEELAQLFSLRNDESGAGLTRSHLAALTRVKDKAKALRLAEQAVANGWTKADLVGRVQKAEGGPRSKGGRKNKAAADLPALLRHMTERTNNWLNSYNQVYSDPKCGLAAMVDASAATPTDPAVFRLLEGLAGSLVTLAQYADTLCADVKAGNRRLRAGAH